MTHGLSARPRGLPRPLAILLTLAILVGPAPLSTPALAARPSGEPPLDLAAMALAPDDLTAEGMDGYGLAGGGTLSPEAVAAGLAFEQSLPEKEAHDLVADADLLQAYELRLDLAASDGEPAQSVRTTIHAYAEEGGATGAFAILTGWVGVTTALQVSSDASIGDESTLTRLIGTTATPHHGLDLTFRSGRVIASVRLVDFIGGIPAVSDATRLAARLLTRIQAQSDDPSTGLGPQTMRVGGASVIPIWDYYTITDGRIRPTAGQPTTNANAEGIVEEAGIISEYEVSQRSVTHGSPDQDTYLYTHVLRFADADAAAAYLRDTPDRVSESDEFAAFEEIPGLRQYGDEFVAFTQEFHWAANDIDLTYETYVLRVGPHLAQVQLIAPQWTPYGALEDLAAAQAGCLDRGACADAATLPAALVAMVQDVVGEDDSTQPKGDVDPFPSRPFTYVGPTFGVELSYDPATWSIGAEESDDDADRLILFEKGTPSTLTLSAYPAAHDAGACIADLTAGFADEEAYGGARQVTDEIGIPIAALDTDLAYAAYGLALDDGTQTFMYLECRSITGGDVTLLITQVGPLDQYPAREAARQTLLDGLDLPAD